MSGGRLDMESLAAGVALLAQWDDDLRGVLERHGPPPLWGRPPGFETLVRIMLEQQVSLASGNAMYRRMRAAIGRIVPETVLRADEGGLRAIGVTRQKASYIVGAAASVVNGNLDLRRVTRKATGDALTELTAIRGIGPWTAEVYLLMALRRPDIWPTGDIALLTAIQRLRSLDERPSVHRAAEIAERWTPWRAVAARILWHGYLCGSLR